MANDDVIVEGIYLAVNVTTAGVATLWADANESCTNWAYRVDNGSWISVAGTRSNISLTNLTGYTGVHYWEVRAYSIASQQMNYSDAVKTMSDPSPATISLSVSVTDLGSATLTATANASCTDWAYQIDNGSWNYVSGTSTTKTFGPVPGMTGTHTYRARATKVSNDIVTTTDPVTKTTDTSAPTISLTASISGTTVTLSASSNVSCSGWAYQIDGGSWNYTAGSATSKTFSIPGMSGTHRFRVQATKVSNNVVGYSQEKSTTADTDRPTISLSATINSSAQVTLSATANENCDNWAYQIDYGNWAAVSGTGSTKTITIPGMTGSHSFRVKATKVSNGAEGTSSPVSTTSPTLSLSKTATSTSGSIDITVNYLPANTAVQAKYGSTVLKTNSYGSAKNQVTITYSSSDLSAMFTATGVTTQQSVTITVLVNGYSYTAASFTLSAGSGMGPTVGTPTATIVQGSTVDSSLANVYIAGISKAKIAAAVTSSSGSSIQSVVLSYNGNSTAMSYNSSTAKYEATTPGTLIGSTTFTVTATDARGLTGAKTVSVTDVKSWTEPSITFDTSKTYRCDSSGTQTEGGPYLRVKATLSCSTGVSGNGVRDLYCYIKEDPAAPREWLTLTSGVQSTATQLPNAWPNSTVTVVVKGCDKIGGYTTRELQLAGAHRDFTLANYASTSAGRRVTALGVGMAPDTSAAGDTVQLPAIGRFTIGESEVQNFIGANTRRQITGSTLWNKNLLAFDQTNPMAEMNETTEFFVQPSDFSNWSNLPSAISGQSSYDFEGTRMVIMGKDSIFIVILEQVPVPGRIWVNTKYVSTSPTTWSGWKGHTPNIT